MCKKIIWLMFVFSFLSRTVEATTLADYKDTFRINLEEDNLPSMSELEKHFDKESRYYDPKYHSVWELLGDFDADFYARATTYGINEKRLKWEEEDMILEYLSMIPKSMYPYIGPMLFEVPNMSEKVLNLPGIKETKNQFPKRIAPQLKDIENLEFLSPTFYLLLMPEMWPSNEQTIEYPQMTPYYPKVKYNPEFYAALRKLVPPEDFMPNAPKKLPGRSEMRTVNPNASSLLTAADVEALASTLPAVEEWYQSGDNSFQINRVNVLLFNYENSKTPDVLAAMREIANPCARLVQKAKLIGQERDLALRVASQGFSINEWAYTCDKTIKAYRLSKISLSLMQALRMYKRGLYDTEIEKFPLLRQGQIYSSMQALISSYQAPLSDVMEVRKKRDVLENALKTSNYRIGGITIRIEQ